METLNRLWFASTVPALLGFGLASLGILTLQHCGWSLFVVLPVAVCFLSAFFTAFRREVSLFSAYWPSVLSLVMVGGLLLFWGLDGLICLVMALPLAMGLGLIGAVLGRKLGSSFRGGLRTALPVILVLAFPGLVAFDRVTAPPAPLRSVTTRVIVEAPIERVWQTVIAFPEITEPPGGFFRLGIAYPIEARIDGSGVGAVRHCVFSTGAFVEPITAWQEPTLLAFDVESCPPPLDELSPYEHLEAPHLHGLMASHRGQFRLEQTGSRTTLEGTTWYSHDLSPQWYWGPISDYLIHRIHERVLHHIERTAESG